MSLTRRAGELTITLSGPETITVGETATYTADAVGATSVVWVAPDGGTVVDQTRLDIRANSPGTGVVTLIAVGADERLVVELEFRAA